jgi:hypothetical protein
MSPWYLAACFCLAGAGFAAAQTGNGVNSGLNSDGGSLYAPNIDRVIGTNANGTPRQESPGSSMTNGAGNSTMTPGVAGSSTTATGGTAPGNGIAIPTINGLPPAPRP